MNSRPVENCYWVIPGKLLAGEYPRNYDHESSPGKVAVLTDAGVSAFIDLAVEGRVAALRPMAGITNAPALPHSGHVGAKFP